jgi:hypothetical protein
LGNVLAFSLTVYDFRWNEGQKNQDFYRYAARAGLTRLLEYANASPISQPADGPVPVRKCLWERDENPSHVP